MGCCVRECKGYGSCTTEYTSHMIELFSNTCVTKISASFPYFIKLCLCFQNPPYCLYLTPLKFFLLYKFSCVLYVNATSIKILHQAVRVQASYSYSFNNPELA